MLVFQANGIGRGKLLEFGQVVKVVPPAMTICSGTAQPRFELVRPRRMKSISQNKHNEDDNSSADEVSHPEELRELLCFHVLRKAVLKHTSIIRHFRITLRMENTSE